MYDFIGDSQRVASAAWDWAEVKDVITTLLQLPEECVGFVGLAACALLHREMGIASDLEIAFIESLEASSGMDSEGRWTN